MKNKFLLLTILAFLFIPQIVSANFALSLLSLEIIPLFPFIILIEAFVFWLLANKIIKVKKAKVGFWKLILVVLIANIVTSLLGILIPRGSIPLYKSITEIMWIGLAFIASVFIEWGIYIPFFRKVKIKNIDLLKISFVGNLITYVILAFLLI